MMSYEVEISVLGRSAPEKQEVLPWLRANCPSYKAYDLIMRDGIWIHKFEFGDEKDSVWFKLRWQ